MLEDKVKKGESLREDLAKLQVENEVSSELPPDVMLVIHGHWAMH